MCLLFADKRSRVSVETRNGKYRLLDRRSEIFGNAAATCACGVHADEVDDFMQRLRELAAVDVLRAYRQQAERHRDDELAKALRLLQNGSSAEEVLAQLARGLTNKLLHAPSVQLKKLSADGRFDALAVAQELFALDEGSDKRSQ